jgi:hypothetical protein
MKTIQRIFIKNQQGDCSDKAYEFVKNNLKRRYGNAVTFALAEETEAIIKQLQDAGFECKYDGYSWSIMEPSDYIVEGIISITSSFGINVPLQIVDIIEDNKYSKRAKVKYVDFPRKRAFFIKAQTQDTFIEELKKELDPYNYGLDIVSLLQNIK